MPTTLFRPVGLHELALIWDLGMRVPATIAAPAYLLSGHQRQLHRARAGCLRFNGKKTPLPNYRHWQKLGTTALSTWRARFLPTESPYT